MTETQEVLPNAISKFTFQDLKEKFTIYQSLLSENSLDKPLRAAIQEHFVNICEYYLELGYAELGKLAQKEERSSITGYLLHFGLPEFFKDLLILHRDVLLQLTIASHKNLEGLVAEDIFEKHRSDSYEVLTEATSFFLQKLKEEELVAARLDQTKAGVDTKIKHLQNPWEAYAEQFKVLLGQLEKINGTDAVVTSKISVFSELKRHTENFISKSLKESEELVQQLENSISKIENFSEMEDLSQTISTLEKIENSLSIGNHSQEEFTAFITEKTGGLTKINLPVAVQDAMLLEKTMDFGKSVKKWMDFNLLPIVIELWEQQSDLISYVKHSIVNIKGNLSIAKSQDELDMTTIKSQSLQAIRKAIQTNLDTQRNLSLAISEKLKSELLVTSIYGNKEFLEVSLQTSLTQYTSDTNDLFTDWKERLKSFFGNMNTAYDQAISVKNSDLLEIATACIAQRMLKEENAQYDILFLNKNFLGDLFLTPRLKEKEAFEKCFQQWNLGFNKAVLLVGTELSGKSTFISNIIKEKQHKNTVYLTPDSCISFHGRKFDTTRNLKAALQNIKKLRHGTKPIVIIDDIELWRSKEQSLLQNVRSLMKFIESESGETLVVVITSKLLTAHLDHRVPFSNSFTTQIDLEQSTNAEILNAIRLRHGASHRTLIDENGLIIPHKVFEKHVNRLCKTFGNSMGEVLQAWTYGTAITEDYGVIYHENLMHFPDFFMSEEVIILKYTLLYKSINELTLKTFLGKRYQVGFESGLKRLTNTKVLLRDDNGLLSLNTVILHDVREILIYRGILN